jgi:hypothetical protein
MNRKRPAGVTDREGKALKLDDGNCFCPNFHFPDGARLPSDHSSRRCRIRTPRLLARNKKESGRLLISLYPLPCATADAATKDVQKHVLETVMFKRLMRMSNPNKVASRLTKIDFTDLAKSLSSVSEENEARTLIVGIVKRNSA